MTATMTEDSKKLCPQCGVRVFGFQEDKIGPSCLPCGCRLSDDEYLTLMDVFIADDPAAGLLDDDDDDGEFGLGGDWWK